MNKTVTLVDGTIMELKYGGEIVCTLCGTEYDFGVNYCDENIGCAGDDGESLVWVD